MQSIFQNRLTDIFANQTKLRQVKKMATCNWQVKSSHLISTTKASQVMAIVVWFNSR
jgi:hypothetical protein